MEEFKVIENKTNKVFYVVNTTTGQCVLETENKTTAETTAENLNCII